MNLNRTKYVFSDKNVAQKKLAKNWCKRIEQSSHYATWNYKKLQEVFRKLAEEDLEVLSSRGSNTLDLD